jgi:hypothetical protein
VNKIDVEDTLRLIKYIKQEQTKGFTKEEIREKLLGSGWRTKDVDKYLTDYVLDGDLEKASADTIELFAKYGKFLLPGEQIKSTHSVGFYNVVFTENRVILLKKFPKNILEFNFKDIELVEYYTDIQWLHLLYFFGYFFGSVIFFFYHSFLWENIVMFASITQRFFDFQPFLGMNVLAILIFVYLIYMALRDLYYFVASFTGKFRIMPRVMGPTDIMCKLTGDVERVIQVIEEKIHDYEKMDRKTL